MYRVFTGFIIEYMWLKICFLVIGNRVHISPLCLRNGSVVEMKKVNFGFLSVGIMILKHQLINLCCLNAVVHITEIQYT